MNVNSNIKVIKITQKNQDKKECNKKEYDCDCCNHDSEKKIQEYYLELKLIEQQMKQIQKQLQLLEQQISELVTTKQGFEEISNIKKNSRVLFQFASGIYSEGTITSSDEFIVGVGAGVFVKKKIEDAKEMIDKQINEMRAVELELLAGLENLDSRAREIEKKIITK